MTKRLILLTVLLLAVLYAAGTWTTQGNTLVGSGGSAYSQGIAVVLSNDGNTALIGGTNQFWVWTRSGTSWTQQAGPLTGTGQTGTAGSQGMSVALSSDGNTAAVGGPLDNFTSINGQAVGAVWIWTRNGNTWTQGSKLVASPNNGSRQGSAVALSSDGNTLLVGGPLENSSLGATWVWTRSGSTWTQQTKLVASDILNSYSSQGASVALSSDGNTALVGASSDANNVGAASIFTRSGSIWTQQGPKLVGSDHLGTNVMTGSSVSLSSDGNTAMVGGSNDNVSIGAVWVFVRSAGVWNQQGLKLVGSDGVGQPIQGCSVSLAADGNTAIVGGYYDNNSVGASWIWTRSGTTWTQLGMKIAGAVVGDQAGYAVAMSGLGTTALVGSPWRSVNSSVRVLISPPNTRRVILVN